MLFLCYAGGEMGKAWASAGSRGNKANGCLDLADCLDYLFIHRFSSAGRVVVQATSAGAILAGALLSTRPQVHFLSRH